MQYRRAKTPGASYFFTVVTYRRHPIFNDSAAIEILRQAMRHVMDKRPFDIDAAVVLPNHLHCIWTLPENDADFPTRWRLIKTWFSKNIPHTFLPFPNSKSLWQPRYWEHLLRDETDFRNHVEYIHYNPVKHGYAKRAVDWPYSSFGRYVEQGLYPEDWGVSEISFADNVGQE